jgi:flagellar biosynthesis protein FliP
MKTQRKRIIGMGWRRRLLTAALAAVLAFSAMAPAARAATPGPASPSGGSLIPENGIEGISRGQVSTLLQILIVMTVLTLAPAILMMMTSFTRIIIVLSFLRNALATQQVPPYQILAGLALFLTFIVMGPTFSASYNNGVKPFLEPDPANPISQQVALERTVKPFREFMFKHVRGKDLQLFLSMNEDTKNLTFADRNELMQKTPTLVLIPAFVVSELRTAFWMGFLVFLPFLVIDLVISSILLSMGMLFLPPYIVSLPFKVLLFVLVDGWALVVGSLVRSFHT